MKLTGLVNLRKNLIFRFCIFVVLIHSTLSITAQKLPDYSGVWIQDTIKSDDFYRKYDVRCTIKQTPQLLTVITTFSDKSGEELVKRESSFTLDGKETTDAEGAKKSARWSSDKKVLTTSDTKNYGGDIVGVTASYSLSENGRILTVVTKDVNPMASTLNQIFNKNP